MAFDSGAGNLVPDDTTSNYDAFVHDRQTGETTRVSVASDGTQGDGESQLPSISADGRYVAFASEASNLVPGDTNGWSDVFVHDRWAPTCGPTYEPMPVRVGEAVAFRSNAHSPAGQPLSYWWDFGDGAAATVRDPVHAYAAPGLYQVCVTVADEDQVSVTCCIDVPVGDAIAEVVFEGPCWHMMTIPCQPVDPRPRSVFREASTGAPVPIDDDLHRYDHSGQRYVTYRDAALTEFGSITPGDGYWLWVFGHTSIGCAVICGGGGAQAHYPTSGWHLTGSGVLGDVPVADTLWWLGSTGPRLFADAANTWVQDPLCTYSCALGRYQSVGLLPTDEDHYLRAFRGYWLYTFVDDVTVEVPAPVSGVRR